MRIHAGHREKRLGPRVYTVRKCRQKENWLSAGSENGGEACAVGLHQITRNRQSARAQTAGLPTDILERPATARDGDIDNFLPMNWTPSGWPAFLTPTREGDGGGHVQTWKQPRLRERQSDSSADHTAT